MQHNGHLKSDAPGRHIGWDAPPLFKRDVPGIGGAAAGALWVRRLLLAIALFTADESLRAAEPSDAERAFELLKARYERESQRFFAQMEQAATDDERMRLYREQSPANTMVDEFLAFEADHRGTRAGLSALYHLVSIASGGGDPDDPVTRGRGAALDRLGAHYADHADLDVFCWWLPSGQRVEEIDAFLRRACESLHRHVRGCALLYRAVLLRSDATLRPNTDAIVALASEILPADSPRLKRLQEWQQRTAGGDPQASREQALQILEMIVREYADVLEPSRTPYGPLLLEVERGPIDPLTQKPRRSLAKRSESLKFELTHLAVGQQAPEISGPDAFGHLLKLSDHRGKVVVLMFSFKGCGPCEAMYPGNRTLVEQYRGRPFAILGVMGDEELATVKRSVQDGTITWPVWWDGGGTHGPTASRWNIVGWPEVFVLDHNGIIRYRELRGELLEGAVAKLVAAAEREP